MKKIGEIRILNLENKEDEQEVKKKDVWGTTFKGDVGGGKIWDNIYFVVNYHLYIDGLKKLIERYNDEHEHRLKTKTRIKYGKKTVKCYIARPKEEELTKKIIKQLDEYTCEKDKWKMEITVDKKDFSYVRKHEIMKEI